MTPTSGEGTNRAVHSYLRTTTTPVRRARATCPDPTCNARMADPLATTSHPQASDPSGPDGAAVHETLGVSPPLQHLLDTLETLGDAVIVTTLDGVITTWSSGATDVLGWEPDEALGHSLVALLDPSPADVDAPHGDTLLGATAWQGAATVTHRTGTRITVHLSLAQVDDATGEQQTARATVLRVRPFADRDVTAQHGQEVALRAREERLRLALSAVWDGLWDWHVPTGYCYYAPRWYSMLGFEEHALPPHIDTFLDLLHPNDVPACESALREHFDGRADTYALEVRLRTASNTWRWVLTRGTVVERDAHGRPVRMVGTHTDIAERKQAELDLRTSEDRFRTLTMASPLGIFLTDASGACTFVTPRMRDLWGAPASALLGRGFLDAAHPDDRARITAGWDRAVRDGGELTHEYRVRRPDGDIRWVCERTAAHRDGPTVTGFVGTVEDITAQKVAAADRRRLEAQMQHAQKLESLGVLAGGIAHDFNNLLVGILGNVSVARQDVAEGTPHDDLLADIEIAARRAAELTTQLLAYAGKGRFNVHPFDVSAAVRETSSLLHSAISKRATLTLELGDELPLVAADGTQVRQVIMNLLTNASDALGDHAGDITLRTGTMHADASYLAGCLAADGVIAGEFVYVEVADTGIGMNRETLARIFDPFFTTKFTGRGLGLAATLGIVRGHRGALHVETALGMGTTFRVLLPAVESEDTRRRTPAAIADSTRRGTILVVDDEESVRNVARRMLERCGYRVITATDGDEGLRTFVAEESAIVAIVSDVTMPRMSGLELLAELRRQGKRVPVVLASGYAADSLETSAGDDVPIFVQKPFVTSALLAGIDAARARPDAERR
jgi:two-component system cell cycle sensor histidine kinase/response regulator CckA